MQLERWQLLGGRRIVSRGPLPFRQTDVARAIKGAVAAGLTVQRVEVDKDGKIVVVVGDPSQNPLSSTGGSEWDRV
jgi:hypothetical protein